MDKSVKLALWAFIGFMALSIIIGVVNMIAVPADEETVIYEGTPTKGLLDCLKKASVGYTVEKPADGEVKIRVDNSKLGEAQACLDSVR